MFLIDATDRLAGFTGSVPSGKIHKYTGVPRASVYSATDQFRE